MARKNRNTIRTNKISVEFLFTYYDKEQEIWTTEVPRNISQSDFMLFIFNELGKENVNSLLKISTCQYGLKNIDQAIKFLMDRNGKYYFNTEVNNDDDTKYWEDFKKTYCDNN